MSDYGRNRAVAEGGDEPDGVKVVETPIEAGVRVATIDASAGSVYFVGDESDTTSVNAFVDVYAGQTIMTAGDAIVGLLWANGGSLRIDKESRVRFTGTDEIELLSGRVYYDSGGQGALAISTRHGQITNIGTRYMTRVGNDMLVVSVRDGRVRIDGVYHDAEVDRGREVTIRGSARPESLSIRAWGPEWEWIEVAAPDFDAHGQTAYAFLLWVCRETGLTLDFASDGVERVAREETFKGTISVEPRVALRQQMAAVDLDYIIDENGVLTISERSN